MSSGSRIGLVLATLVALVVALIVLSPGGDDDEPADKAGTTTSAAPATTASPAPARTSTTGTAEPAPAGEPAPPAAPTFITIIVRDGKPVGGVQTITVTKGERARIAVSSPDTSDEIHLHGYDLKRDLEAGGRVRFSFTANADGIFEIELEGAGTQIGKLVVEP